MTINKNDAIAQGSVDRRELATCALFISGKVGRIRSKSELIRLIVNAMADIAVKLGGREVKSVRDATEILDVIGFGNLNPGGKLRKSLSENMQKESLDLDNFDNIESLDDFKQDFTQSVRRTASIESDVEKHYEGESAEAIERWKDSLSRRANDDEKMKEGFMDEISLREREGMED